MNLKKLSCNRNYEMRYRHFCARFADMSPA